MRVARKRSDNAFVAAESAVEPRTGVSGISKDGATLRGQGETELLTALGNGNDSIRGVRDA